MIKNLHLRQVEILNNILRHASFMCILILVFKFASLKYAVQIEEMIYQEIAIFK
jgi:hypothetical protein